MGDALPDLKTEEEDKNPLVDESLDVTICQEFLACAPMMITPDLKSSKKPI